MFNKSVDLVGWRTCARQKEWGPKRFALTLKKISRQAAHAGSLPPPPNAATLTADQRKRLQQHQEIRQAAAVFNQGTPECAACGLSNGKPYGCHATVDYPIDATAERALFEFFSENVQQEDSTTFGIWRDLVAKVPGKGTAWHTDRGPTGSLAELDEPLAKEWGFLMWKKRIDSAQILGSLFFNQTRISLISAFAKFWEEFIEHARRTVPDFESSKSLMQLEALAEFYERTASAASTMENIYVLVEDDAPSHQKPE
jgi:hypothetical protein